MRHGLITPEARRCKQADYKRWERSRAMELWQMDVVGGVRLDDRSESKVITGLDDHSRFCVGAFVTPRATARPTCDALALAMRRHGAPDQILTDNGKVFTNRFGSGTCEVLFDRMCRDNGIRHLLTAPRSPTTTGKVERFHKTLRREFLDGETFSSIDDAQAQLDAWVHSYDFERPHQSLGRAVPWERFKLAKPAPVESPAMTVEEPASVVPTVTRRVGRSGLISFARALSRRGVARRRGHHRGLRERPRAAAPSRRARGHPRPSASRRQAGGRAPSPRATPPRPCDRTPPQPR